MESEAPSSTSVDAPSDEHDWLFDYVMSAFQSPSWEVPLLMFIDFNWCAQAACPFFELPCACVRICGTLPPSHPHLLFAASYLIVMKRTSLRTRTCIGCAAHCCSKELCAFAVGVAHVCTQRTGAVAHESLQRNRLGEILSPAFHACGSVSPFAHAIGGIVVYQVLGCALLAPQLCAVPHTRQPFFSLNVLYSCLACCNCEFARIASCLCLLASDALYAEQRLRLPWRCVCCIWRYWCYMNGYEYISRLILAGVL